jgi:hypothetical protein
VIDPDSSAYMGLARSLLTGEGYTFAEIPHTKYPPLFPLLLAVSSWWGGQENYALMQYMVAMFWVLSILFTYLLFSKSDFPGVRSKGVSLRRGPLMGLIFALCMTTSIYGVQYATVFLRTEPVYTALSLGAVFFGLRIQSGKTPTATSLAGFLILFQLAFFTRMAGAALAGALMLILVLDKNSWVRSEGRWIRFALILLLCASGPVLWKIRNDRVQTEASTGYGAEFNQAYGLDLTKNRDLEMEPLRPLGLAERVLDNTRVFAESCAKMIFNSNKGGAKLLVAILMGGLCGFGLLLSLVQRRSFVDYYCLIYLGIYWVWPFNQQQRFYLPLLPFLLEYAAQTMLLLNRLLPVLLRQTAFWYGFLMLQVPMVALLFGARSKEPEILGRYSLEYLLFALTATLALVVADGFLLVERLRPGGLKWMVKTLRVGLPFLYITGFSMLGVYNLRVTIPKNHEVFLAERREHPVHPAFEKIEAHPEFINLATWVLENTGRRDVIMCDVPKMLHILTERPTVPFTFYGKKRELAREVAGLEPSYVYYSGEIDWIYPIFKEMCADYEKVFSRRFDIGGGEFIEPALYRIPK